MHGFACNCPTCHDLGARAHMDTLAGMMAFATLNHTHDRAIRAANAEYAASRYAVHAMLRRWQGDNAQYLASFNHTP